GRIPSLHVKGDYIREHDVFTIAVEKCRIGRPRIELDPGNAVCRVDGETKRQNGEWIDSVRKCGAIVSEPAFSFCQISQRISNEVLASALRFNAQGMIDIAKQLIGLNCRAVWLGDVRRR